VLANNGAVGCGDFKSLLIFRRPRQRGEDTSKSRRDDELDELLAIARQRLRAGLCHRCGDEIEDGLARVASVLCYDCRAVMGVIGLR
jgi:hypothetical protein